MKFIDQPELTSEDSKRIFMPAINQFICENFERKWESEKESHIPE